ncbi:RICIN domain-containing protein [Streptomyces sp. NPDC004542]|uniref:RICIN domain-containing protein n=1 Tax=Streptomyces sp. NPDC004542 TaxID=3154281 RepID=UPI0033B57D04
MPRLAQFSSLGSRAGAGRAAGATPTAAGPAEDRPGDAFARDGGTGREAAPDVVVPLRPAARRGADRYRREGFRGALAVVGIVGLLSAGGALLTLNLLDGHDDAGRDGVSVSGDSGRHDTDVIDGLGVVPDPAQTSGTAVGKVSRGSEKPTSASPGGSASSEVSASPGAHATASAQSTTGTKPAARGPGPGVRVYSHASQRCIDVVGGKAAKGAKLMIWDCGQTASQHWTFTGGTMRTLGMCVQPAGGSTADGADLELGACNGSPAQEFTLNHRNDLVSELADKCADVRDNGTANGTRLQLWSCSGGDNQKWSTS